MQYFMVGLFFLHVLTHCMMEIMPTFCFSAPSAPPEAITVTALSPYSLLVSWQAPPPDSQNGEIRYYTIKVLEEETDTQTWLSTSNSSTNITVESLHPYYSYRVSVAAYSVGLGPYSLEKSVQMPESGETQQLSCPVECNINALLSCTA